MKERIVLGEKLMFPSEFVAAVELKGKDVHLTIQSVNIDELVMEGGIKNEKPVLRFKETQKRLVLNKTNAKTIAGLYGTKAQEWVGKRITIYPTKTRCGGEQVDCIRVRDRAPAASNGGQRPTQAQAVADEPAWDGPKSD